MRGKMIVRTLGVASVVGSLMLAGCGGGGSTTGGGEPGFGSDTFVATDAGSLSLKVTSSSIPVASTSNFNVTVLDASGAPVPQIQVSCDTDAGLSLIEPVSGSQLTDSFGGMSGVVGCEAPGSFQMACRLPIGANKRKFASINCTGAVPAGFAGFDGAGGGLGGGVDVGDDGNAGGTGTDGVRIVSISVLNSSGTPTTSVDTTQDVCVEPDIANDEPGECEAFSDDIVEFQVENNSNQIIRISSYTYTVPESTGTGGASFTSKSISADSQEIAPGGEVVTFSALFAESVTGSDGTICPLEKRFPDASFSIGSGNSGDLGFRSITFRLRGTNESGDSVTVTATTTVSFDNFGNCP